jgi:hypothetical protein
VLREGTAADAAKAAELQEFAKASIAPYKYPRVVEFVSELPKTISGKTQRFRLRLMAEQQLQARSGLSKSWNRTGGGARPGTGYPKIPRGRVMDTTQFGRSTTSLIFRSPATLHKA